MKSDKARKWLYTAGAAASVLAPYVIPHLADVAQAVHAPAVVVSALAAAAVAYKAFKADPDKTQKEQDAQGSAEGPPSSDAPGTPSA